MGWASLSLLPHMVSLDLGATVSLRVPLELPLIVPTLVCVMVRLTGTQSLRGAAFLMTKVDLLLAIFLSCWVGSGSFAAGTSRVNEYVVVVFKGRERLLRLSTASSNIGSVSTAIHALTENVGVRRTVGGTFVELHDSLRLTTLVVSTQGATSTSLPAIGSGLFRKVLALVERVAGRVPTPRNVLQVSVHLLVGHVFGESLVTVNQVRIGELAGSHLVGSGFVPSG